MSVFKDRIWKEILDGKKDWLVSERKGEACDLFEVEVVLPLRDLQEEGRIRIEEIEAPVPGRRRTVQVILLEILRLEAE
jgi:hypothetical protein